MVDSPIPHTRAHADQEEEQAPGYPKKLLITDQLDAGMSHNGSPTRLNDWHFVLVVLFAGIAPFAHKQEREGGSAADSITGSCSMLLSRRYHTTVGQAVSVLYEYLGTTDKTCQPLNLQLHAANSVLLYVVVNQLLSSQRLYSRDMRQQTSAIAAIFFAVHPSHTVVTEQAAGIDESLSLALCLVGVLCLLPLFANKLVQIYAPASVVAFVLAGLVKSDAADVPLVIALLLALQVLKIPLHTGKRLMVGACLLVPMVASIVLEMHGRAFSVSRTAAPVTAAVGAFTSSKRDATTWSSPPTNGTHPVCGSGSSSSSSSNCIDFGSSRGGTSSGWGGERGRSSSRRGARGSVSVSGSRSGSESGSGELGSALVHVCVGICEVIWQQMSASARPEAWHRDPVSLPLLSFVLLLVYVVSLCCSVAHTVWQVCRGRRAHGWAVSLLAFSILCIRSALPPTPSGLGGRTYLPGCLLSILLCKSPPPLSSTLNLSSSSHTSLPPCQ